MTKHMINTLLIVASVYIGLLFVIKHPIAMALINEGVEVTASDTKPEQALIKGQPKLTTSVAKTSSKVTTNSQETTKSKVTQPIKDSVKQTKQLKSKAVVGLTQRVDLNSAESINTLWLKFQGMSHLQNHVRWDKAPIAIYAYYHNFNADFTQADLSLGYRQIDIQLAGDNLYRFNLPSTTAKKYGFNSDHTSASDAAWAAAYQFKNLVEEYWLDSQGNIQSQNAFVYQ